jgi:hypothetical protein
LFQQEEAYPYAWKHASQRQLFSQATSECKIGLNHSWYFSFVSVHHIIRECGTQHPSFDTD